VAVDADVEFARLELSQGAPGTSFVDYAAVHMITTATLEHIGVEAVRYRPNLVATTPPGFPPFEENNWVGKQLHVGGAVLGGISPTPRCAVPTLEHGELPMAPHAVRVPMAENRVEVPGIGVRPSAGAYLSVLEAGIIRTGDEVRLGCGEASARDHPLRRHCGVPVAAHFRLVQLHFNGDMSQVVVAKSDGSMAESVWQNDLAGLRLMASQSCGGQRKGHGLRCLVPCAGKGERNE